MGVGRMYGFGWDAGCLGEDVTLWKDKYARGLGDSFLTLTNHY